MISPHQAPTRMPITSQSIEDLQATQKNIQNTSKD